MTARQVVRRQGVIRDRVGEEGARKPLRITDVVERIGRLGLVPVLEIADVSEAGPLAEALVSAGLPCAEVTLRTPAALEALRVMRARCPDLLLGAGTILTRVQAHAAAEAGADFL